MAVATTRRMMPASMVLSPVLLIRTRSEPLPFTVPAMTSWEKTKKEAHIASIPCLFLEHST